MAYLSIIALFLPLIFLLWLANVADKRRNATPAKRDVVILVYVLLGLVWGTLLAVAVFAVLMGVAYARYADIDALSAQYSAQGLNPEVVVQFMKSLPRLGSGLFVLAVVGIALLLRPVRRLLARLIPISVHRVTHTVALTYSVFILINLWLVMGVGLETVADAITAAPDTPSGQMIALLWLQNVMLALMAFIGVGWLSRRRWRSALLRLGLTWSGWKNVSLGIGLGLGMFLFLFPLSLLLEKTGLGVDPNIENLTEKLIGPLMTSLPGVISLGVAAALGEELTYRGALQPRFGIFLTALLFALTHNQYGVSLATLVVFFLGLALGWTRVRYNTTTSIFLHATYNIAIGLAGFLFH